MKYCSSCGHELGVGRYCTNCGQPVEPAGAWRTDTAERAAVPPEAPPSAPPSTPPAEPPTPHTPPPPARFPLFADEVEDEGAAYDDVPEDELVPYESWGPAQHRRRVLWPWLAGAAVLLVVIGIGLVLLTGSDDEPSTSSDPDSPASSPHHGKTRKPSTNPSAGSDTQPGDVAADSSVTVPATAPPGQDADGNRTTYVAANMLDGDPSTAWRMAGDGSGEEVVVTLPEEAHLTSVGLVNGYAKTTDGIDWYHGNRRIQSVQWVFDDGSTVDQDLGDTTDLQSTDVDVTTTKVTLRLVTVSAPGKGASSRDYTAISDLSLISG
ncbi:discoidin domain-containing protein [Nocardioides mangrovi]|uniref:Discoidin domain-containing protein n=1 Tax=Nocardioides mangrovi TaxID=2874580 RepID=A0ABS7U7K0_9ACTN|nr:discoidin domain-containing protein [Nocardioides mangrovi]MBZ5736787.1 discoidin domain-containing protein [Nocardioides mangrovi]